MPSLASALAASAMPLLLAGLAALVAVRGRLDWLASLATLSPAQLPGAVVAWALLVAGLGWSAVASIFAIAGAAPCSRARACAAWAITLAGLGLLAVVIVAFNAVLGWMP